MALNLKILRGSTPAQIRNAMDYTIHLKSTEEVEGIHLGVGAPFEAPTILSCDFVALTVETPTEVPAEPTVDGGQQ